MTALQLQPCYRPRRALRRRAPRRALGAAARRVFAVLREWHRRSRDRAELAGLDDRALLDIGLSRADAEFLINKPFWRE